MGAALGEEFAVEIGLGKEGRGGLVCALPGRRVREMVADAGDDDGARVAGKGGEIAQVGGDFFNEARCARFGDAAVGQLDVRLAQVGGHFLHPVSAANGVPEDGDGKAKGSRLTEENGGGANGALDAHEALFESWCRALASCRRLKLRAFALRRGRRRSP